MVARVVELLLGYGKCALVVISGLWLGHGHEREEKLEAMPEMQLLHCLGLFPLQQTAMQKSILSVN